MDLSVLIFGPRCQWEAFMNRREEPLARSEIPPLFHAKDFLSPPCLSPTVLGETKEMKKPPHPCVTGRRILACHHHHELCPTVRPLRSSCFMLAVQSPKMLPHARIVATVWHRAKSGISRCR